MVCPKNACAGGYGNCLDVKITNICNGCCSFCIEKNGYNPSTEQTAIQLATKTISQKDYSNVLILGGEPLMYHDLLQYLSLIRPFKKNIYLTTNGSLLKEPDIDVAKLGDLLDGLNISIHHFTESENDKVFRGNSKQAPSGKSNIKIRFDQLKTSIAKLKEHNCPVRINCNLVKGFIENKDDIDQMIKLAENLGANEIRFTELQNNVDDFIDAYDIFTNLPEDPFKDGCEITITKKPILVRLKVTCGRVNPKRKPVKETPKRKGTTKVMYCNGEIKDGWSNKKGNTDCHCSGCH